MREKCDNFSLLRIRSQESQLGPGGADDKLFLGACELTQYCLDDVCWRLDRQRVQEHVRGCRHGHDEAQSSAAQLQSLGWARIVCFVCLSMLSSRLQLCVRKLAARSQKFWRYHKLESVVWRNNFAAHCLVDGAGWQASLAPVPQPMDVWWPELLEPPR